MHLSSIDQNAPLKKHRRLTVRDVYETVSDQSEVFAAARSGLALCRVPRIVDFIRNTELNQTKATKAT